MATWKIEIETENLESFYTVMKACEDSNGVHIIYGGMIEKEELPKRRHRNRTRQNKAYIDTMRNPNSMTSRFLEHLKTSQSLTLRECETWMESIGYATSSVSPLVSQLNAHGLIEKKKNGNSITICYSQKDRPA
jgi:hypothetical protein